MIVHPRSAHVRVALSDISARWLQLSTSMAKGERGGDTWMTGSTPLDELDTLLVTRGRTLAEWAADDSVWVA